MSYIYKITNKINNKIYIGQTKDYKRRFREHKNQMSGNASGKYLYNAFNKYGIDNFSFEIIEETKNPNIRENYWINFYQSNNPNKGYNYLYAGKEHPHYKELTEDKVLKIKKLLSETELSCKEIAGLFGIKSEQSVQQINKGITYYHKEWIYPIRLSRKDKAQLKAKQVIEDLKKTSLTFKQIAEKNGYKNTSTISQINAGERCFQKDESYPIRIQKTVTTFPSETIQKIKEDIKNTSLSWKELAQKYGGNEKVYQHINNGKTYFDDNENYPLRKTQKNKKLTEEQITQIVFLLKTTKLTQKEIAEQCGCSPASVSSINTGRYNKKQNEIYPIRHK